MPTPLRKIQPTMPHRHPDKPRFGSAADWTIHPVRQARDAWDLPRAELTRRHHRGATPPA